MLIPKCQKPMPQTEHTLGSLAGYYKKGCRCKACKAVARDWREGRAESLTDAERLAKRKRKTVLQQQRRQAKSVAS